MKRDAVSGAALIVGTVSGLVTMALHPSGHQLMADYDRIAPLAVAVHVLALAGMPITFLGALGLTRRLSSETATAALVAYGFATVAAMSGTSHPNTVYGAGARCWTSVTLSVVPPTS